MNIAGRKAEPERFLWLIGQEHNMVPALLFSGLKKAPFLRPFPDETEANVPNGPCFTNKRQYGVKFMNDPKIARIHHDELTLKVMLVQKFILTSIDWLNVTPVRPVQDSDYVMGRQSPADQVLLHTSSVNNDLIHLVQGPERNLLNKTGKQSLRDDTGANSDLWEDIL